MKSMSSMLDSSALRHAEVAALGLQLALVRRQVSPRLPEPQHEVDRAAPPFSALQSLSLPLSLTSYTLGTGSLEGSEVGVHKNSAVMQGHPAIRCVPQGNLRGNLRS